MITVLGIIFSAFSLLSIIFIAIFIKREGNDERGDKIMGNAGITTLFSFLLGYVVIFILNIQLEFSNEQFVFANTCLLTLVLVSYQMAIYVLKKQF